ncbi:AglZ/HisF2 family acetamidino modification protein [Sphingosinicella rhizophila]|uniref:Imidazole glycerol phosphate synthase subunit HisF n=1 Tax=Sphingosinicella rhizophila TaxID=3050082 RepID=A0ABU3Q8A7_9SPHN|nr:AglZ/HisF2 family acetamidino modification protein [Sphingosinicella sp. GR2756]MDT9599636.1 AglZ/HisF2 family acetamidino modification protein [Sphingosinicella sp. GR2756]
MLRTRIIPTLLLRRGGLVKTIGFAGAKYVGDPINSVKIFNEKEVDELILLDIHASKQRVEPDYDLLSDIVSEAFMPIAYGGGVRSAGQARRLVGLGIEKIILNSAALRDIGLVRAVADKLGSSSTLVAVDVKRNWLGKARVFDASRGKLTSIDPVEHVRAAVAQGAGEIFINDVQRDGTGKGLDLAMIAAVAAAVRVPLIACGGAGSVADLRAAADAGASAVAAGSLFVYMGRHRAVMINYPAYAALEALFS